MTPVVIVVLALLVAALLLAIRVPIMFALGVPALLGNLALTTGNQVTAVGLRSLVGAFNLYSFSGVILWMVIGGIMVESGLMERYFSALHTLLGRQVTKERREGLVRFGAWLALDDRGVTAGSGRSGVGRRPFPAAADAGSAGNPGDFCRAGFCPLRAAGQPNDLEKNAFRGRGILETNCQSYCGSDRGRRRSSQFVKDARGPHPAGSFPVDPHFHSLDRDDPGRSGRFRRNSVGGRRRYGTVYLRI